MEHELDHVIPYTELPRAPLSLEGSLAPPASMPWCVQRHNGRSCKEGDKEGSMFNKKDKCFKRLRDGCRLAGSR